VCARFHNTVAGALLQMAEHARRQTGIRKVALAGGVFCNRFLTNRLIEALKQNDFAVLWMRKVPANDGGLALGQAAIAAARMEMEQKGSR
jgi:hydrogenase maturation protein HypF